MRILLIVCTVHLFIASCQSGTSNPESSATQPATETTAAATVAESAAPASDYQMEPDTIEIKGKFLSGCEIPDKIKIAQHDELHSPWKEVPVNSNGEFSYRVYLPEPRRIAMRTEKRASYDFLAVTKEPVYEVEIACANGREQLELKSTSNENIPYRSFTNANRKFKDDLEAAAKNDITTKEGFEAVKNVITEYQNTLAEIASAYPGTVTAEVFCKAENLPEGSLASADALRKNFLNRASFANPYIYNDFLGQRILLNYLTICDRSADNTQAIDQMMNFGAKDQLAAKRLQQITYNVFYNRHEEELLINYIKWAESNPDLMYNQTVKSTLARLNRVMPGKQYLEITLNDPSGAPKKLSDEIASSKLTLLIFYSPTCSHCQVEIPELKPIWDQYKSKGLKIYIVGFDATSQEWDWFIKNKAYAEWTHVFDSSQSPSYQYVVNYTPTFILIDPQGKIITRLPELEDVKTDIPKILN